KGISEGKAQPVSKGLTRGATLKVVTGTDTPKGSAAPAAKPVAKAPTASAGTTVVRSASVTALAASAQVLELREETSAFKRDYEERAKEFVEEVEMDELFSDDAQAEAETARADADAAKAEAKKLETDRRAKAIMQGYTGNSCPECQNFTMVRNGTCEKCDTCGSTSGCS
ncbi:MAG: vitamin B12-dependent ribonucleotide reductase, partial [Notoacmeibacter sp.]|nr:vitamin B12-dependent ribonucleotide reductase [Notoacmeibacter sp.]